MALQSLPNGNLRSKEILCWNFDIDSKFFSERIKEYELPRIHFERTITRGGLAQTNIKAF